MAEKRRILCKIGLWVSALAIAGFGVWYLYPPLHYNIHTVYPKQVYRSAQMPARVLAQYIKRDHLHSVINMRGAHPKSPWYQQEHATANKLGVKVYDVTMPAHGMATKVELQQLLHVLQQAKPPLIVHCRQGADRTGIASGVIKILHGEKSLGVIDAQSSWRYLALAKDSVGKLVFAKYGRWLHRHGYEQSTPQLFGEWVAQF